MKTKILFTAILVLGLSSVSKAATITINNNNNIFTPDYITINQGDTVIFDIGGYHDVVEVSQATWDANENTSNDGFTLDFGGGELVFNATGIFHYVCTPHAYIGMKGIIEVSSVTSITDIGKSRELFLNIYPNPVSDILSLQFNVQQPTLVNINMFDITGRSVRRLIKAEYNVGIHTEILDLGDLKPGKYFIHYETNSGTKIKSVLKLN